MNPDCACRIDHFGDVEHCLLHASVYDLRETIRHMRQTIHQAHHEGPIEGCPKTSCAAAARVLMEVK